MPEPNPPSKADNHFKQCPACGGERASTRLKTPGDGNYILLETGSANTRFNLIHVAAWVCPACGHTDLQAQLPYLQHDND